MSEPVKITDTAKTEQYINRRIATRTEMINEDMAVVERRVADAAKRLNDLMPRHEKRRSDAGCADWASYDNMGLIRGTVAEMIEKLQSVEREMRDIESKQDEMRMLQNLTK